MSDEQLHEYRCTKHVHAAPIVEVDRDTIVFELPSGARRSTLRTTAGLRNPDIAPGWVLVVYADGYASASPKDRFDEGYVLVDPTEAPAASGSR